jgi:hypothetical protein
MDVPCGLWRVTLMLEKHQTIKWIGVFIPFYRLDFMAVQCASGSTGAISCNGAICCHAISNVIDIMVIKADAIDI